MTTVECWDEYSWEQQQEIIEENQLMQNLSEYLQANMSILVAWKETTLFIDPTRNNKGCKSFLLSYLLQKAGLTQVRVSKEQLNIIEINSYTYTETIKAIHVILKHPEWKEEFKETYNENKKLMEFTYKLSIEQLRNII